MLNSIALIGRLTRDPEIKRTPAGVANAKFTLAVDRDFVSKDSGNHETDFIDISCWRNTAEFVERNLSKGRMAGVSGRLQIRSYQDKDGNRRYVTEVVADNVYPIGPRGGEKDEAHPARKKAAPDERVVDEPEEDGEYPF